jgi:HEAT repeat protein
MSSRPSAWRYCTKSRKYAAAYRLMQLGPDGRSAAGALRDALQDPDERVAKAARIALEYIETDEARPWFV